jgi:hypothetical protein
MPGGNKITLDYFFSDFIRIQIESQGEISLCYFPDKKILIRLVCFWSNYNEIHSGGL